MYLLYTPSVMDDADLEVRYHYGGECTFFIKGNNVFTENSISNFAVLLDPRMFCSQQWYKQFPFN